MRRLLLCMLAGAMLACALAGIGGAAGTGSDSAARAAPSVPILTAPVSAPAFSSPAGTYSYGVAVTLSTATPGALIYYTLDGLTPTITSTLYTGAPVVITTHVSISHDPDPLSGTAPLTFLSRAVRAIAVKDGEASALASAGYAVDRITHTFNVPYDTAPPGDCSNKHLLDIYQPRGQVNTPVVFFVHGGAWREGDKNVYPELGNVLAGDYQLTAVIINYRLTNDACSAQHPEHVQDVARAFQWTVDHIAGYGGDPDNIHVLGQSAGGHLVSLLATDSQYLDALGVPLSRIRSVTSMSGAYNLGKFVQSPDNPLGLSDTQVLAYRALFILVFGNILPQTLLDASPGYHANAGQPPFHIIGLTETAGFYDMPGFALEAGNFYSQVAALGAPPVEWRNLQQSDIPPEILALDFPDFTGDVDGHYEELYAVNTRDWNSVPARMIADYVKSRLPLQVTAPNGGEVLAAGDLLTITWHSRVPSATVSLAYSPDDGQTWQTISSTAPNNGRFVWPSPSAPSWLSRIRISAAGTGGLADMSTHVFALAPARRIYLPVVAR